MNAKTTDCLAVENEGKHRLWLRIHTRGILKLLETLFQLTSTLGILKRFKCDRSDL